MTTQALEIRELDFYELVHTFVRVVKSCPSGNRIAKQYKPLLENIIKPGLERIVGQCEEISKSVWHKFTMFFSTQFSSKNPKPEDVKEVALLLRAEIEILDRWVESLPDETLEFLIVQHKNLVEPGQKPAPDHEIESAMKQARNGQHWESVIDTAEFDKIYTPLFVRVIKRHCFNLAQKSKVEVANRYAAHFVKSGNMSNPDEVWSAWDYICQAEHLGQAIADLWLQDNGYSL